MEEIFQTQYPTVLFPYKTNVTVYDATNKLSVGIAGGQSTFTEYTISPPIYISAGYENSVPILRVYIKQDNNTFVVYSTLKGSGLETWDDEIIKIELPSKGQSVNIGADQECKSEEAILEAGEYTIICK